MTPGAAWHDVPGSLLGTTAHTPEPGSVHESNDTLIGVCACGVELHKWLLDAEDDRVARWTGWIAQR